MIDFTAFIRRLQKTDTQGLLVWKRDTRKTFHVIVNRGYLDEISPEISKRGKHILPLKVAVLACFRCCPWETVYSRCFKSRNKTIIVQHVNKLLKYNTDVFIYRSKSTGLQIRWSASTGRSMSTAAILACKDRHIYTSFPAEESALSFACSNFLITKTLGQYSI